MPLVSDKDIHRLSRIERTLLEPPPRTLHPSFQDSPGLQELNSDTRVMAWLRAYSIFFVPSCAIAFLCGIDVQNSDLAKFSSIPTLFYFYGLLTSDERESESETIELLQRSHAFLGLVEQVRLKSISEHGQVTAVAPEFRAVYNDADGRRRLLWAQGKSLPVSKRDSVEFLAKPGDPVVVLAGVGPEKESSIPLVDELIPDRKAYRTTSSSVVLGNAGGGGWYLLQIIPVIAAVLVMATEFLLHATHTMKYVLPPMALVSAALAWLVRPRVTSPDDRDLENLGRARHQIYFVTCWTVYLTFIGWAVFLLGNRLLSKPMVFTYTGKAIIEGQGRPSVRVGRTNRIIWPDESRFVNGYGTWENGDLLALEVMKGGFGVERLIAIRRLASHRKIQKESP